MLDSLRSKLQVEDSTALLIGTLAAVFMGGILAALDAQDQAQEPATDTSKPIVQRIRVVAAGVAIGAIVVGLGSVVWDPFVD